MNSYKTAAEAAQDKGDLIELMDALDVVRSALCRDENGLWILKGSRGYASTWGDRQTWHLIVHGTTSRQWGYHQKRLRFAELVQDGDDEGCFRLRRPLNEEQTAIIREIAGLHRRMEMTPERLERLRQQGFKKTA